MVNSVVTAFRNPASFPTCGQKMANKNGPTNMHTFVNRIALKLCFSAFSASPDNKRQIWERQHANIRQRAGKIWQNVQKRMIVAITSPGGNIRRQLDTMPLQPGMLVKQVPENPKYPRIPHIVQDMKVRKYPMKTFLALSSGFFAFLIIGKVITCKKQPPPRIPRSGGYYELNSLISDSSF